MATPTYDLIASQVLSTSAASVTFSSIPATYRDLVLVLEVTALGTGTFNFVLNGDTNTANYSVVYMEGNGTSAISGTSASSNRIMPSGGFTTTDPLLVIINFQDYSATDKHTSLLSRANSNNASFPRALAAANRWANTAAVTSIQLNAITNNFASGSTFHLYGIAS